MTAQGGDGRRRSNTRVRTCLPSKYTAELAGCFPGQGAFSSPARNGIFSSLCLFFFSIVIIFACIQPVCTNMCLLAVLSRREKSHDTSKQLEAKRREMVAITAPQRPLPSAAVARQCAHCERTNNPQTARLNSFEACPLTLIVRWTFRMQTYNFRFLRKAPGFLFSFSVVVID